MSRRVSSGALATFPESLGGVGFVRERWLHSRTRSRASVSSGCVRSIPVSPRGRLVRSGAFPPIPEALWVVRVFLLHFNTRWGSYGALGPFPVALGVYCFVRVRSVHSSAPRRS